MSDDNSPNSSILQPGWRDLNKRPNDLAAIREVISRNSDIPVRFGVPVSDAEAMAFAIQMRETLRADGVEVRESIHEEADVQPPFPPLSYTFQSSENSEWIYVRIGNKDSQTRVRG